MGYQDRDYYQENEHAGFSFGQGMSLTVKIILINAVLFLVNMFLFGEPKGHWLTFEALGMQPDTLRKPWLWYQLVSYGFAHDPADIRHVLWNMVGLFFFGSQLESDMRKSEYLRFYLTAIFCGGLAWGIHTLLVPGTAGAGLIGASGGVAAITLLFCMKYPYQTILFMGVIPTPAWILGLMMVLGDILSFGSNDRVAHDVHLAGALFAGCYFYFRWHLGSIPGVELIGSLMKKISNVMKGRPNLSVHRGEDPEVDDAAERRLEREADRILAKISAQGESSLTRQERAALESYSRRMRNRLRK